MKITLYEVVKVTGFGVKESPIERCGTGLVFHNKEQAEKKADRLWKSQTTKENRESGWCPLNYEIREISLK